MNMPDKWPTNEEFVRAALASTTTADAAQILGLTRKQVSHKLRNLRRQGVRVPHLQTTRGRRPAYELDVPGLNRLIDDAQKKITKEKKRIKIKD